MSQMDRSSEERSRFEKWALEEWHDCEYTNSIDTDYRDADTAKMWDAWQARAALEDRQEAAPEASLARCALCGDTQFDHFQGGYDHNFMWPGVPSEATQLSQHQYLSTACSHGQCFECRKSCKFCGARCTHGCHKSVPSEATPSKENAPKIDEERVK